MSVTLKKNSMRSKSKNLGKKSKKGLKRNLKLKKTRKCMRGGKLKIKFDMIKRAGKGISEGVRKLFPKKNKITPTPTITPRLTRHDPQQPSNKQLPHSQPVNLLLKKAAEAAEAAEAAKAAKENPLYTTQHTKNSAGVEFGFPHVTADGRILYLQRPLPQTSKTNNNVNSLLGQINHISSNYMKNRAARRFLEKLTSGNKFGFQSERFYSRI